MDVRRLPTKTNAKTFLPSAIHAMEKGPQLPQHFIRKHKTINPGLSDLLVYGSLISPGVILGKDGSLIAGWQVTGPDSISLSDADRNTLSERANAALLGLGGGWTLWFDVCRTKVMEYPEEWLSHFPDAVSQAIDDERRDQFTGGLNLYQSLHVMILQFVPSRDQVRRVEGLMYGGAGGTEARAARLIADFEKSLHNIEATLGSVVTMTRMHEHHLNDFSEESICSELVDYIDFCISGEQRTLQIPPSGGYVDSIIGLSDFETEPAARIGEKFIGVVHIGGLPPSCIPGILNRLDLLSIEYRWSTRFIFLDHHEAQGAIAGFERRWRQKIKSFSAQVFKIEDGRTNEDAKEAVAQTRAASAAASSELVGFGYLTAVVIVLSSDQTALAASLRLTAKAITSSGFAPRIEEGNTAAAWLGSLPGHSIWNVRRPPVHTRNLVDFLALQSLWQGPLANGCPMYRSGAPVLMHAITAGQTPFRLSLHVGDVGHTLIFGPIGAGKTFLLCTIALQAMRYDRMQIWAFDYKRGMMATTKAVGGRHYDVGSPDGPFFCPLGVLDTDEDVAWAEGWIAVCFELQTGSEPSPAQQSEIHHAVNLLRFSERRTLSDFVATVQDPAVKLAMRYYTIAGTTGRMIDAETDGLSDGSFVCLETEDFQSYPEKTRLPVMLYLFRRFERALDGRPAMLVLDEAWAVLNNPIFARQLGIWLRVLRSKNCAVIMATQSLGDAVRSTLASLLNESCPTKIFLSNNAADQGGTSEHPGPRDLYKMLGLTDDDIDIIKSAESKRHYYVSQPAGKRLIELAPGPTLRAIAGASSKEALKRVIELESSHGDEWVDAWIKECTQ